MAWMVDGLDWTSRFPVELREKDTFGAFIVHVCLAFFFLRGHDSLRTYICHSSISSWYIIQINKLQLALVIDNLHHDLSPSLSSSQRLQCLGHTLQSHEALILERSALELPASH